MNIVTWNTQWCKGLDNIVSPSRIIDGAQKLLDFDILCLQEISVNYATLTGQTPADQPAEIARLLPGYEIVFGAAVDERPLGVPYRQQFGNLIASRLPILQIEKLMLPSPIDPNHTLPGMARIAVICTVQAAWGPVRIITTHLEYYNAAQRQAQIAHLAQWHQTVSLQARHPNPLPADAHDTPYQAKADTLDTVLCGDFNFTPSCPEYSVITNPASVNRFHDAWSIIDPGQAHAPTFRIYDRRYGPDAVSCDFFFVSDSLRSRLKSLQVDTQTQVSDHQPVSLVLHDQAT